MCIAHKLDRGLVRMKAVFKLDVERIVGMKKSVCFFKILYIYFNLMVFYKNLIFVIKIWVIHSRLLNINKVLTTFNKNFCKSLKSNFIQNFILFFFFNLINWCDIRNDYRKSIYGFSPKTGYPEWNLHVQKKRKKESKRYFSDAFTGFRRRSVKLSRATCCISNVLAKQCVIRFLVRYDLKLTTLSTCFSTTLPLLCRPSSTSYISPQIHLFILITNKLSRP